MRSAGFKRAAGYRARRQAYCYIISCNSCNSQIPAIIVLQSVATAAAEIHYIEYSSNLLVFNRSEVIKSAVEESCIYTVIKIHFFTWRSVVVASRSRNSAVPEPWNTIITTPLFQRRNYFF